MGKTFSGTKCRNSGQHRGVGRSSLVLFTFAFLERRTIIKKIGRLLGSKKKTKMTYF